jgi:ParB family transcriptional regulator, chromosome partitioning protein
MSSKPARGGLGRGLGSLIGGGPTSGPTAPPVIPPATDVTPTDAAPVPTQSRVPAQALEADLVHVPGAVYLEIPVELIVPNPRQPRTVFDEDALDELVHSIKEIGLLQPVVVRRAGEGFELIAGERRLRASQRAGLTRIPAIVRDTGDDDLLRDALLENLHRAQLNPLEEAAAYQQLLDDFGCTQDELATRIGRSRPQVSNTLRLLKLPPAVARRVAAGVLSAGHAKVLLSLSEASQIETLAARIVAEGISVRALEEIVAVGMGDADDDEKPIAVKRRKPVAPGLASIAERLSDRLETRVKVEMGRSKGRITIEFATLDDLQRVLGLIDRD